MGVPFFKDANPIVDLVVTMDRSSALQQARDLAKRFDLGPKDFRETVTLADDSATQYYVELEAGGKNAFSELLKGKLYSPCSPAAARWSAYRHGCWPAAHSADYLWRSISSSSGDCQIS